MLRTFIRISMEERMNQMEIVFAKKGALATKDWDTFQAIIRTCLKPLKTAPKRTRPASKPVLDQP